jgi:hypothetical protein
MEAAMSYSVQTSEWPGFVRRVAHWWRNWNGRRRTSAELNCCSAIEVERIGRDLGVSGAHLSVLAGKWPDAADLLYSRMNEIQLDRIEITQVEPQVMRDLQRVCTVCGSKWKCERELAKNPSNLAWQKYCPNAMTLSALAAERAAKVEAN